MGGGVVIFSSVLLVLLLKDAKILNRNGPVQKAVAHALMVLSSLVPVQCTPEGLADSNLHW